MRRRRFIGLLSSAAICWPVISHSQQSSGPVIGLLGSRSADNSANVLDVFRKSLSASGYVEGQSLTIEYRWAQGHYASTDQEIETAFAAIAKRQAGALFVGVDPFFNARRSKIVSLAAQYKLPAIYQFREFTDAGGLVSYGASLADAYRQAAGYVSRILAGAQPSDLPVLQSAKFELVLNLGTAKALGLTVPQSLLAQADDVIQ